jgi:hypothetical protein
MPTPSARTEVPGSSAGAGAGAGGGRIAGGVADRGADQLEEVTLDPLAREVVRNSEHEGVVVDGESADLAEPVPECGVVERPTETVGHVSPQALGRQVARVLHAIRSAPRP